MRIRSPGLRDGELVRRLQAGHAGHRDVEDDEVHVVRERPLDRLCPVVDLADHAEVRFAVEQLAQPVAHDRMVVGEEHAGDQRSSHRTSFSGNRNATSVPRGSTALTVSCAPTSSARSRMPRIPLESSAASGGRPMPSSRTVRTTPPSRVRLERDHDLASLRVADDVGQALLGDAVDDQLLLGGEREVAGEPSLDLEPRPLGDRRASASSALWSPSSSSASGRSRRAISRDLFRRLPRAFAEPDDVFADFRRERAARTSRHAGSAPSGVGRSRRAAPARCAAARLPGRPERGARCLAARSRGGRASR